MQTPLVKKFNATVLGGLRVSLFWLSANALAEAHKLLNNTAVTDSYSDVVYACESYLLRENCISLLQDWYRYKIVCSNAGYMSH